MQRDRKDLYSIKDSFGCFIEYTQMNSPTFFSLVEFDFIGMIFRKIRIFELNYCSNRRVYVDEFNPSKFALIWEDYDALNIQSKTWKYGAGSRLLIHHYFDKCVVFANTWNGVGLMIHFINY
jgi:hypothetical protein